jgi:exodeoxyribonuclease VIII
MAIYKHYGELKGRIAGMKNEDYHAAPGISKSHLDEIAGRSPMHYWAKYVDPNREPEVQTPALALGQAIHSAILEPDLFSSKFVVGLDLARRSNADKAAHAAFAFENKDKTIVDADDYEVCLKIRDVVHNHPIASGLLQGGSAEDAFFADDPETGALIKCKTDYLSGDGEMVIDVKSTIDASPFGFGKQAGNFRYDIAPAWYMDVIDKAIGARPKNFVFLAFEKEAPWAMGIYYVSEEQIDAARRVARQDFKRILRAKAENDFPDYGNEVLPLSLPGWIKR